MINGLNYIQANEPINGENGALGEVDVANRPLKELISLFNTGDADTQVRRINFKIEAAQMVTDGVVSDDVVSYDYATSKYVKSTWSDKKALGIIDVENLMIYSFGEYTFKSKNDLISGKAYFVSQVGTGNIVDQDNVNASSTHIGIAISTNTIEINKFIDATFASVQIDDVTPSFTNAYSSNKVEELITTKTSKLYFYTNSTNINSLAPLSTSLLNIPLNSIIVDLNLNRLYYKKNNTGVTSTTTLGSAVTSGAVTSNTLLWASIVDKPNFATVSTSGSYNDLSNKPANATGTVSGLMSNTDKSKLNDMIPDVEANFNTIVKRNVDGGIKAGGTSTLAKTNITELTVSTKTILPANTTIGNVDSTELNYLDGATSNIQTQINGKQPTISLSGDRVVITNSSGALTTGNVDSAELNYLDGATSNIQTQINNVFTRGMIIFWSGSSSNVPAGWLLCNGTNNTPNLIDKFIIGSSTSGATGGSANAVVVSHSHSASADTQGNHTHYAWSDVQGNHAHTTQGHVSINKFFYSGGGGVDGTGIPYSAGAWTSESGAHAHNIGMHAAGSHGHNIAVSTNGESGVGKNLPPYYALCYIMKA